MQKIIYCLSFYDNVSEDFKDIKQECTRKILRYLQYIKNKFSESIEFNFVICGSEGDKSKNLVLSENFRDDEYFEFDQTPYDKKLTLIEKKFEYSLKVAIKKYPDLDILLLTGSSDFIPEHFFERLLKDDQSIPKCYGVKSYKSGGSIIYHNFLNDIENTLIMDFKSCLDARHTAVRKLGRKASHKIIHMNKLLSYELIGGVIGFNKKLVQLMNGCIKFPNGNEYLVYLKAIKMGAKPMGLCDYWINIKVPGSDLNPYESQIEFYHCHKFEMSDEVKNFFELIYSL